MCNGAKVRRMLRAPTHLLLLTASGFSQPPRFRSGISRAPVSPLLPLQHDRQVRSVTSKRSWKLTSMWCSFLKLFFFLCIITIVVPLLWGSFAFLIFFFSRPFLVFFYVFNSSLFALASGGGWGSFSIQRLLPPLFSCHTSHLHRASRAFAFPPQTEWICRLKVNWEHQTYHTTCSPVTTSVSTLTRSLSWSKPSAHTHIHLWVSCFEF